MLKIFFNRELAEEDAEEMKSVAAKTESFVSFILFIFVLDLCCCTGFCLAIESKSYSLLQFEGFSSLAVFLAAECRL